MPATRIGKEVGKCTSSITRVLRRNNRKYTYWNTGKYHQNWKGGKSSQGDYMTVHSPGHHRANKKGCRVFEHIIVAEKKYGHLIKKETPVHHIDFNKLNNNPDNLYLCSEGIGQHSKIHKSVEKLFGELFVRGIIFFKDGRYYIK